MTQEPNSQQITHARGYFVNHRSAFFGKLAKQKIV